MTPTDPNAAAPPDSADHDDRRLYAHAFERAKRYALRWVDNDLAGEVAHEVAVSIVERRAARIAAAVAAASSTGLQAERSMNALIYRAVVNRLIDHKRSGEVRAAAEVIHAAEVLDGIRGWADPAVAVETRELAAVIRATIAAMPVRMRTVFLLVRDHDRSYKEVAAELGVGVGTVHTQLSRATIVLRDALDQYRAPQRKQS